MMDSSSFSLRASYCNFMCVCVYVCVLVGGQSLWYVCLMQGCQPGEEQRARGVRRGREREARGGSELSLWPRGSNITPWPLSGECTARTHTQTRMHAHTTPAPVCCCWWELSENETTWLVVRERESKTNTQNVSHPVILCYSDDLQAFTLGLFSWVELHLNAFPQVGAVLGCTPEVNQTNRDLVEEVVSVCFQTNSGVLRFWCERDPTSVCGNCRKLCAFLD